MGALTPELRAFLDASPVGVCVMGHERPYPSATFTGPAERYIEAAGSASAR